MRVLITGAAGFIGYHLTKSLLDDGFEAMCVDSLDNYYNPKIKNDRIELLNDYSGFNFRKIDISDMSSLSDVFSSFQPQRVVNLAAQPNGRYSAKNPHFYINSNFVGFINVIDLCSKFNVEGLIYASSSSVYGDQAKLPADINDTIDKPLTLYGISKRTNELIAYSYSNLYNLNTTGLRYFTVYGPWYRPDMAMSIFTKKILAGEAIPVFNNGNMKRDFTYIDDIIAGTIAAIKNNYNYEIFNLGKGQSEKLFDMIKIIENELNKKAIIDLQPMQLGDMTENYANIKYSKQKLGYDPKITIQKGIPKLIKWYKEYYNV